MKTSKQWLTDISGMGKDHPAACCCDRCKHGHETFLLESDIAEIQKDAQDLELLEAALELLSELECEWRWKQNEPRAGNKAQYETLARAFNRLTEKTLALKRAATKEKHHD